MNKIHNNLYELINSNPQKEYGVIIVINPGHTINELELKDLNVIMDKIITTKLTGTKIKEISKNQSILSIELDADMGILWTTDFYNKRIKCIKKHCLRKVSLPFMFGDF